MVALVRDKEAAPIACSRGRVKLIKPFSLRFGVSKVLVLGMAAALVLLLPGTAGAAPIPDSQFVQFTLIGNGGPSVFFAGSGGSLAGLCAPDEGAGIQLTADVHGWETPVLDPELGTREVFFHADVSGNVTDTNGNVYRLNGSFTESGVQAFPDYFVPFDGFGHLTVSGPAGVVTGDAEFRAVTTGPPEWDFTFSSIQVCNIH